MANTDYDDKGRPDGVAVDSQSEADKLRAIERGLQGSSFDKQSRTFNDQATAAEQSQDTAPAATVVSGAEIASAEGQPKSYYTPSSEDESKIEKSKKLLGKMGTSRFKKWAIGGFISVILGGGGFTLFNIASGPGEFIHYAELLQKIHFSADEEFMDGRAGGLIRFASKGDGQERNNLSALGNLIANHYEKKMTSLGIEPEYQNGRMRSISLDTTTPQGKLAYESLQQKGYAAVINAVPNADGVVRIEFDTNLGSARQRRVAVKSMVYAMGMGKVSSSMATRMLKVRAGVDFHPFKNIARSADEKIADYIKKRQEERAQRNSNGVDASNRTVSANNDGTGENAQSQNDAANNNATEANELIAEAQDKSKPKATRSENIKAQLTAGVGATSFLSLVCGVKLIGDASSALRYTNIVLPLIRVAIMAITMGNQVKSGVGVSLDELGAIQPLFYDAITKTSAMQNKPMQSALKSKQTGVDIPDAARVGTSTKPKFFQTIDTIIQTVPGASTVCDAVNSTVGGWLLSAAGVALAATGPVSLVFNILAEVGQNLLVGSFIDDLIAWIAGEQVDMMAAGGTLGAYWMHGGRLANQVSAQGHGAVPLSDSQEKALALDRDMTDDEGRKHQSYYARYLDTSNVDSVASKVLYETPAFRSPVALVDNLEMLPAHLPSLIGSAFAAPLNLLSGKAAAVAAEPDNYEYGFPMFGFALEEIEDDRFADPYENAAFVEPRLSDLNEEFGECFNTTVDPDTLQLITTVATTFGEEPEECGFDTLAQAENQNVVAAAPTATDAGRVLAVNTSEAFTRYRFYLADVTAMKTTLCYEEIDQNACAEIGVGAGSSQQVADDTAAGVPATAKIDVGSIREPSESVGCYVGDDPAKPATKDLGVHDGYTQGKKVRIRLCSVPTIPCSNAECNGKYGIDSTGFAVINSRASGAFYELAKEIKEKEGVSVQANSTFRTMAHQEQLCRDNAGCAGGSYRMVAKPGTSNHQLGVAIDFGNKNGSAISKGDPLHDALKKLAGKYGIKQYVVEDWHWSPLEK